MGSSALGSAALEIQRTQVVVRQGGIQMILALVGEVALYCLLQQFLSPCEFARTQLSHGQRFVQMTDILLHFALGGGHLVGQRDGLLIQGRGRVDNRPGK